MRYLIITSPIVYIIIAIIFQIEINTILLLVSTGISLYISISYLSTTEKEKLFLKEEIQYFIDSFQNIRKPITLVHTPLQNICNAMCPESIKKELSVSLRNIGCLNKHLTELMGLKHLHIQSLKLDITEYELGSFIKEKLHSQQSHAKRKCIKLDIKSEFNYVSIWGDTSKISPIIEKFISDAIDYIEPKTTLTVFIFLGSKYWEMKIADTENGKLAEIYDNNKYWIHKKKTEMECTFSKSILFKKLLDLCDGKIIINRIEHTISLRFPLALQSAESPEQTGVPYTIQNPKDEKIGILFQKTSRKCINKRRFSNIRNSSHHCTDWTVFNSTAAVTFNFFLAGLLYNILNGLHPRSISGIHFYNMKTFLLKIFFPCFILSFICQICFVQKNQS